MKIERPPAKLTISTGEVIEAVQEWLDKRFEHRGEAAPQLTFLQEAELHAARALEGPENSWVGTLSFSLKPESTQ